MPDEALQGEDVPAHILWEDFDWDEIHIRWSNPLYLKEVFNLTPENNKKLDKELIVNSLQVEGYIGFVFGTSIADGYKKDAEIKFEFKKSGNLMYECINIISLFRPTLKVANIPKEIVIKKRNISNQIGIEYYGYGTLFIDFVECKDNEVKFSLPENIAKMMEEFSKLFKNELEILKSKHPKHKKFLERIISKDLDTRERYLEFFDEYIMRYKEDDPQFIYDFSDVFIYAFTKGPTRFEKIFLEPILNYLDSLVFKNVILTNIFKEISASEVPKKLKIKIVNFDSLNQYHPEIVIPPVTIRGDSSFPVKLHHLIKFTRGDNND